ncbi:MAG: ATP-dependent DNA helicase, partial [Acidimicrobiales bacterium]
QLEAALTPAAGGRTDVTDESIAPAMAAADEAVNAVVEVLRKIPAKERRDGRRDRCLQAASSLLEDVRRARVPRAHDVAWVPEVGPATLLVAPVDVGPELARLVFRRRTAILTSATLSVGGTVAPLARRLGLRADLLAGGDEEAEPGGDRAPFRELRVGSPFDYRAHAVLYCPVHLPDPRQMPKSFDDAALEELAALVQAAGGRTLALFTSHRMLRKAAEALRDRFPWKVHVQDGPPEPGLIERFRDDETSCLLATMGYWQGVDVPGRSLSLVVIDRLPFASPKDPLLEARRELSRAAGEDSFDTVDLPLAATLLAQGAGRLIRTADDRGVVTVLDRRLAKARYRHALLDSLPPMRRSIDGAEVRAMLTALAEGREPPAPRPVVRAGTPVPARVGLAVSLGDDPRSGSVTELLAQGAVVELSGGEVVIVPWGRPVVHEGARRPLVAPEPA